MKSTEVYGALESCYLLVHLKLRSYVAAALSQENECRNAFSDVMRDQWVTQNN